MRVVVGRAVVGGEGGEVVVGAGVGAGVEFRVAVVCLVRWWRARLILRACRACSHLEVRCRRCQYGMVVLRRCLGGILLGLERRVRASKVVDFTRSALALATSSGVGIGDGSRR